MTRRPPRPLRADERELWRRFASGVKPLDPDRLKALEAPEPPSAPPSSPARAMDQRPLPMPEAPRAAPPPSGMRRPTDRSSDKRLRRGRVEIDARLDLHGLTAQAARGELLAFLARAHRRGFHTVLVITGKGARGRALDDSRFEPWSLDARPLPGVLRRAFEGWMREPDLAALCAGYSPAHARHGGDGAFYVILRR
ncbi:DNA mismatch repair protein MutS [Alkalicaulis satelles]|uniref:DNA mismatch repair protein MutS n=1 Tax=Alkalicaulis satelles TaxID=2609175 RepID=A0A5M6ZGH8_9PROT|nr:Smr/MutS family protein [Alkalicaulis satelles]KAA5803819.1 DNA mismatch repair protein MutS [Alkalicaulis satelles]